MIALNTQQKKLDPELWVTRHGEYLKHYALGKVRNTAIADDMVQETFLAALKAAPRFTGQSTERTWLTGILKHKIADFYRTNEREQPMENTLLSLRVDASSGDSFDRHGRWRVDPSSWRHHPSKALEHAEAARMLEGCVSHLKGAMRDAFHLREMEGHSAEEICGRLNITENHLWVLLHRARARLRSCVQVKLATGQACEHSACCHG
jgi:RNA polymerase sigma-70 factor, ECF subfamily